MLSFNLLMVVLWPIYGPLPQAIREHIKNQKGLIIQLPRKRFRVADRTAIIVRMVLREYFLRTMIAIILCQRMQQN